MAKVLAPILVVGDETTYEEHENREGAWSSKHSVEPSLMSGLVSGSGLLHKRDANFYLA